MKIDLIGNNEHLELKRSGEHILNVDELTSVDVGNSKIFYGTCSTAGATKTVVCPEFAASDLVDGVMIIVKFSAQNTGAVASISLNVNGTGVKGVKKIYTSSTSSSGNTAITNLTVIHEIPANSVIPFIYNGTYWIVAGIDMNVDTNTTYTITYNQTYDAGQHKAGSGSYAVTRYSLLLQKLDGTWEKTTSTASTYSTATTKTVNTNGFLLNQIVYYGTTTTVANGALIATNTCYRKAASVNMAYSTNCGTAPGWAVGDYIYLVGTMHSDGLFYLDTTTWWSKVLPTTNDGKLYIRLGIALTTADATMSFLQERPIFYHDGTGIRQFCQISAQPDWNQTTTTAPDYIENKPAIKAGTGTGAVIEGDITNNIASGDRSHAEGNNTKAIGSQTHTEGNNTIAYEIQGHAEGAGNATGVDSIFKLTFPADSVYGTSDTTEGLAKGLIIKYGDIIARMSNVEVLEYSGETYNLVTLDKVLSTEALTDITVKVLNGTTGGNAAHSEGMYCMACGDYSHAEGNSTITRNLYEHAQGRYNKSNTDLTSGSGWGVGTKTIHSVGIGTDDTHRANAVEVMQNGDVYIKGAGSYDGTNPGGTGVKTLQTILNEGAQLEVEEASLAGMSSGSTRNLNLVLVDGNTPYDPQSGNVVTSNNTYLHTGGLGVSVEASGSATLYCDLYNGDISYASTYVPSGKVLIGNGSNRGSFRNTTQEVPASTSVTAYTSDYIVGAQALLKSNERYIVNLTDLTNINASYNVALIQNWWGNSVPLLGFSQFPANKHITLFIMGEINSGSDIAHYFNISPKAITIDSYNPDIFLNGAVMGSTTQITVPGNGLLEMDLYYTTDTNGTYRYLIIRYA